jgi:ferredoxin
MTETNTDVNKTPLHYVSTLEEARELTKKIERFWIVNCGCRGGEGNVCKRSRHDVCLEFSEQTAASGPRRHEITRNEVEEILKEAKDTQLVSRPFRDFQTRTITEGICFCCDCCCGYFKNPEEICDKGVFIEKTDMDSCTNCGVCVDACYFKARTMHNGEHYIDREKCYGCGLCVGVCPENCIEMIER